MKEFDQIFLPKRLFAAITGHLCLTKGHLDIPEGQVGVESPLFRTYFSRVSFILRNSFYSKRAVLMKDSIPRCFVILK